MVYFALGYPYLQYCLPSWGGTSKTSLQPLLIKQKIVIKTMLWKKYTTPSSPLFHQLGLLKLPEIYDLQIGTLMFNKIRNNTTQHISSLSEIHSHNTRSSNQLNYFIPSVSSNLGKTSFKYYGPIVWNSLPNEIKVATKSKFKFLIKNHLLQKYLTDINPWNVHLFSSLFFCHFIINYLFINY